MEAILFRREKISQERLVGDVVFFFLFASYHKLWLQGIRHKEETTNYLRDLRAYTFAYL